MSERGELDRSDAGGRPTRRSVCRAGLGLVGAGLTGVLAGCRPSTPRKLDPLRTELVERARRLGGEKHTLTVLHPRGSLGNVAPLLDEFRRITGVRATAREAALDEISAEMTLAHELGSTAADYDVALPPTFGIPDLAEAGVIEPLDEFAAELEPAELSRSSLYTLGDRYRGRLYGYQADGDAYVMFYNRDWLRDPEERRRYQDLFGVDLDVPQTWSELDRQMRFFHRPDEGRFGGSLFRNRNYVGWEYWIRLHAQGVWPLTQDLEPVFDGPASEAALTELVEASRSQEPAARTNGLFENFESFADGRKYCNIGWGGTQKYLNGANSAMRGRLEFGPVPGGVLGGSPITMPYFNWGWNWVVSSRSPRKELAYVFTLFASTPDMSTLSVREPSGFFDPHRREHYSDDRIVETYGPEFLKVHEQSLANCIPDLYLRGQGNYLSALKNAVHSVDSGYIPVRTALVALKEKWNRITDELGRERQVRQWCRVRDDYPTELRRLLT